MKDKKVKEFVKKRYGELAKTEGSCCSSASCGPSVADVAKRVGYSEEELRSIPEASSMGLGCGNPVALASVNEGETVLDLGSGGGIDAFLVAKKVGPRGKVIGVDMTPEMIHKARENAKKGNYENVEFRLGEIENLPLEDDSVDVVISNCVINLSPDKEKVFQEVHRVLKQGGRIMISDLVTEGELSEEIRKSFDAWACCVAGALEKSEYLETIRKVGFQGVEIVSQSTYSIDISRELSGKVTSVQVKGLKS